MPPPVIAAFWALETDFGAVQGDFHTLDALATLSHDCRRPELFRPQLMPLLKLIDRGIAAARRQGRLGRRDRPDADPAHRLSGAAASTATATAWSTCAAARPTSS